MVVASLPFLRTSRHFQASLGTGTTNSQDEGWQLDGVLPHHWKQSPCGDRGNDWYWDDGAKTKHGVYAHMLQQRNGGALPNNHIWQPFIWQTSPFQPRPSTSEKKKNKRYVHVAHVFLCRFGTEAQRSKTIFHDASTSQGTVSFQQCEPMRFGMARKFFNAVNTVSVKSGKSITQFVSILSFNSWQNAHISHQDDQVQDHTTSRPTTKGRRSAVTSPWMWLHAGGSRSIPTVPPAPQRKLHQRLHAANKTQTLTWLRSPFFETADLRSSDGAWRPDQVRGDQRPKRSARDSAGEPREAHRRHGQSDHTGARLRTHPETGCGCPSAQNPGEETCPTHPKLTKWWTKRSPSSSHSSQKFSLDDVWRTSRRSQGTIHVWESVPRDTRHQSSRAAVETVHIWDVIQRKVGQRQRFREHRLVCRDGPLRKVQRHVRCQGRDTQSHQSWKLIEKLTDEEKIWMKWSLRPTLTRHVVLSSSWTYQFLRSRRESWTLSQHSTGANPGTSRCTDRQHGPDHPHPHSGGEDHQRFSISRSKLRTHRMQRLSQDTIQQWTGE